MRRTLRIGQRAVAAEGGWQRGNPVELDADALVRHAFVCGASGFGKTVFCKGLVEEAVLAGIPVIAVDLKGDLASLALHGPLATAQGLKNVFGEEAEAAIAEFDAGASATGFDAARANAYSARCHARIFTPNSSLGRRVALSALPSFPEPITSPIEREERDELIQALVQGFAHAMYGTPAAVKKNEPAVKFVEELVRWCADRGEPLEGAAGIARILELVREPPFDGMGGMSLEQYLPNRAKQGLMQKLNSRLLGAERSRYEGPRLSVETLLGGVPAGKTPMSIVYLGHVSDFTEQSAVVGQLCADIYRWMRKVGGSSGVRLLVYIDELGGGDAKHAFYPSAPHSPPSKAPLNLLVRQGRSAGIAMLLATQNPMSVDVRGLGNINTWALGRLTRKNDHTRVEDLLSRMPGGVDEGTKVVSQLPQGMMVAMSDALDGPQLVMGRWLYSIHRQLSPGAVGAIHALLSADDEPEERAPAQKSAPATWKVEPAAQPEKVEKVEKVERVEKVEKPAPEPGPLPISEEEAEITRTSFAALLKAVNPEGSGKKSSRKPRKPKTAPPAAAPSRARGKGKKSAAPPPEDEPTTSRFASVDPEDRTEIRQQQSAEAELVDGELATYDGEIIALDPKPKRARKPRKSKAPSPTEPTRTAEMTALEDEEATAAGVTQRMKGQVDPDGDTDAHHTAAHRTASRELATQTMVAPDPEAESDTDEIPTSLEVTRKQAPRRSSRAKSQEKGKARPKAATPPEEDTGELLADSLIQKAPRKAAPKPARARPSAAIDPEETSWVPLPVDPSLAQEDEESATVTMALPARGARGRGAEPQGHWIVQAGPQRWTVGPQGLTLGRSPRADAQIADKHVSRMHLRLEPKGRALVVSRLHAKNPTWLEGQEIADPVQLEPRAAAFTLQVGDTSVLLSWSERS